jgi:hypothetical protein
MSDYFRGRLSSLLAFALVGSATLVLIGFFVEQWNQRYGSAALAQANGAAAAQRMRQSKASDRKLLHTKCNCCTHSV